MLLFIMGLIAWFSISVSLLIVNSENECESQLCSRRQRRPIPCPVTSHFPFFHLSLNKVIFCISIYISSCFPCSFSIMILFNMDVRKIIEFYIPYISRIEN